MPRLIYFPLGCILFFIMSFAHADASDPIVGDWQTYDDRTGGKRAVVRVSYNKKDSTYYGRIIKRNFTSTTSGVVTQATCYKCPKPFTNKKIDGMVVAWRLKKQTSKKRSRYPYQGGYIIDPTNGRIYGLEARVLRNGRVLQGRAHLPGIKSLGRRQTWLRIEK